MNHATPNKVNVQDIMENNKQVILLHANRHYLLSITRRGKLILTAAEEAKVIPQIIIS